jgi:hypothetical protein
MDGDQARRRDGNLPFASRSVALLSMTVHWTGQAFVEGEILFYCGSSNGGFLVWGGQKYFIFQWELADSLSAIAKFLAIARLGVRNQPMLRWG